jgi:ribA/ribD-fused uncharacterized protein
MLFNNTEQKRFTLSRIDPTNPLAAYSKHSFELDGEQWPSVEHYYQAMKFEEREYRDSIRNATHPADATKLGKSKKHDRRKDWDKVKVTYMTRATYIKCRTHPEVARTLMETGDMEIMETSQYDYYWGCGRDLRGDNAFGKMLMAVRDKLREEMKQNQHN